MVDKSTGRRTQLVRLEGAKVAGVYHPLIHEKVMKVMHRYMHLISCIPLFVCVLPCLQFTLFIEKLNLSFLELRTDMIRKSLLGLLTIVTPWRRCYMSMWTPL